MGVREKGKGAGKSPRVLVYLQVVRGGCPLISFAIVLAAGWEYLVRALDADETELILDQLCVCVHSGTA